MEKSLIIFGIVIGGFLMMMGIMNNPNQNFDILTPSAIVIGSGFIALAIMKNKEEQ